MRLLPWLVMVAVAGMLASPSIAEVIGQNDQEVRAVADPILDTVLEGFNKGNYALYSKYFDDTLKDTISDKKFHEVRENIKKTIGAYQSRTYLGYLQKAKTTVVLWKGSFDRTADDVLIKLVVSMRGDKYQVLGLWFQ